MWINRFFHSLSSWTERHWVELFGTSALMLLLLFVLWPLIVYSIPPGHVGVMWYRFFGGTITDSNGELGEGFHLIFPWDKIYIYDVRLQSISETINGLSVDGLNIKMDITSRFVIDRKYVGFLHKSIGPNYQETLMRPQLRNLILTYISEQESSDLYSVRRSNLQSIVSTRFQAALANISTNVAFDASYIRLEDVLIEEITLPSFVRSAIEQKERVRHMSEAYEFRLRLEERERQRKRIEAEGIRSFQEIVAPGITKSYLRWRGIEATLQLAQSNNAKVIVIGSGGDGLPIILNADGVSREEGQDPLKSRIPASSTRKSSQPLNSKPQQGSEEISRFLNDLPPLSTLAGPAPLTASGSALLQEMMSPPGMSPQSPDADPLSQAREGAEVPEVPLTPTSKTKPEEKSMDAADTSLIGWFDRIVNWPYREEGYK
ncbi:MAG: prohibitin family protein [Candidatus Thiodiazotropha sp.]|jgi:prohibitin 2